MRRSTFATIGLLALAVSGCGSSKTFANKARPDAPVNLTVYVDDHRVSVSPASVGAGEVVFFVTNQARTAVSLTVHPSADPGRSLADTGPINPQSTAQVTVDFTQPGRYQLSAGRSGGIHPAGLHIGHARAANPGALTLP